MVWGVGKVVWAVQKVREGGLGVGNVREGGLGGWGSSESGWRKGWYVKKEWPCKVFPNISYKIAIFFNILLYLSSFYLTSPLLYC